MDVARQGEQLLLADHGNGLLAHRPGRLFQVQIGLHGDVEHIQSPGGPTGHQGFEHPLGVLSQLPGHARPVQPCLRVVGVGGVGDVLLVQHPHDVGLFFLF